MVLLGTGAAGVAEKWFATTQASIEVAKAVGKSDKDGQILTVPREASV
jgi:hypothetical protein